MVKAGHLFATFMKTNLDAAEIFGRTT